MSDDLVLAHRLADAAAGRALAHFRTGVAVDTKRDGSPVTAADRAVEALLVEQLAAERPDDGVVGEEGGHRPGRRRWILDPIDGTREFVAGGDRWGTHVALEEDGDIVLAVVTRPVRGLRWWAERGGGAWRGLGADDDGAVPLRTSTQDRVAGAQVMVWPGEPVAAELARAGAVVVPAAMDALLSLLGGSLDAIVSGPAGHWDHAPAVVLVEEAGGRFGDRHGGRRPDRGRAVYTNGALDAELRAVPGVIDRAGTGPAAARP